MEKGQGEEKKEKREGSVQGSDFQPVSSDGTQITEILPHTKKKKMALAFVS